MSDRQCCKNTKDVVQSVSCRRSAVLQLDSGWSLAGLREACYGNSHDDMPLSNRAGVVLRRFGGRGRCLGCVKVVAFT